jgi:hypothetical protein
MITVNTPTAHVFIFRISQVLVFVPKMFHKNSNILAFEGAILAAPALMLVMFVVFMSSPVIIASEAFATASAGASRVGVGC